MRLTGGIAAVVAIVATTLTVLPGASAEAAGAGCTPGHGVTVVVEFNQLGGHDVRLCDAGGGGRTAARLLEDNGLSLTYVQRQPGFICRVAGVPTQDPCVNTPPDDAYWSLWWSDGSADTWTYATTGVDSLTVPDGGSVALAWDGRAGDVSPSAAPRAGGASTALARPAAADRATDPAGAGLPGWVAPAAIGLLLAAAAGTAVVRRRRGTSGP